MSTVERIESYVEGRWDAGKGPGAPLVNPTTEAEVARADTTGIDLGAALAYARREAVRRCVP